MDTIRVLVVDDHPVFRFGLRAMLQALDGVHLAGEATSGAEALRMLDDTQPDVVLMDIQMPGLNGVETTRALLARRPSAAVLMLTMFDDSDTVFAAMRAGARGYILKGEDLEHIGRAIKAVAAGEALFGQSVAQRVIGYFSNKTRAKDGLPEDLTEREREILNLLAMGLTNSAIAERLVISNKTVRNHVSNVLGKLQVADRAQAIIRARDAGLGRIQHLLPTEKRESG
jgi:DNA-binding NarL/FixJ family response regulator